MDVIREKWDLICENIKKEYKLTDISFDTWVKPLKYYKTENKTVYIVIDSDQDMNYDYISNKFTSYFKVVISDTVGEVLDVVFKLKSDIEENTESVSSINNEDNNDSSTENVSFNNLNPKYKFENFVVGSNNKMAFSACLAVAETPGDVYNPLYIYGDPGLGKTHLMHSIGHMILEQNPNKKVLYVTSEEFMNEIVDALRFGDAKSMNRIRNKYRTVDVLLIDDIQFILGKDATQEEFFHTFNTLHESHKQIVISSDKPPKEFKDLDERFNSRFSWGLIIDIKNPDYETRMAILKKNAEKSGININNEVIHYIAENIVSNIRELEGSLNKVLAYAKLSNVSEPTIETAVEALKDIINPLRKIVTAQNIIDSVCEVCDVKKDDVFSQKRLQEYVLARQIIMYFCYEKLSMSYKSIAKLLNKNDHTTIMHGVNKIRDEISSGNDDKLMAYIEEIKEKIS